MVERIPITTPVGFMEIEFRRKAKRLVDERWIDQLLESPSKNDVLNLHLDWFGFEPNFSEREWTHDERGVQYASTFHGFNHCDTELVLQVDSDLMVCLGDKNKPTLPYSLFDNDPLALTWSLPIAGHDAKPYSVGHRFEVRGCLVSIPRLRRVFQLEQHGLKDLIGREHWYRIVDKIMGNFKSYRGGQKFPYFVHPSNCIKHDANKYLLAIDAVQSGRIHPRQYGVVDWIGFPKGRNEPFVILVCGRNVAPGRMIRCMDSIKRNLATANNDVGLIIIDDCSSPQSVEFLRNLLPTTRTTFVSRRERVFSQTNINLGCRELCDNPKTVICTVDLDDCLLGEPIPMIQKLYNSDPHLEAAFGGCVHVDKCVHYHIDETRPVPPRDARGQPFWTHLRTFRKLLFDRIYIEDLRIPFNKFEGSDWAYCIPIMEQARKVKSLKGDLYLYEPDNRPNKERLEDEIGQVMALPPYSRRRYTVAIIGDADVSLKEAFQVGYHLARAGYIIVTGGLGGVMEEACRGAKLGRGTTVGILPGSDPEQANPHVDIPIPTDMSRNRNGLVALASAVVVVGGRAGTFSEAAIAWGAKRLLISMRNVPGCSKDIADKPLDSRVRYKHVPNDQVYGANQAEDVVTILQEKLPFYQKLNSRL